MPAKTLDSVVSEFPETVQARYDFSNASYTSALNPIEGIVCPEHGEFRQYAAQLRKDGAGCPKCGAEKRGKSKRLLPEEFIAKCRELHLDKYDYSKTQYTTMTQKVRVICPEHGEFVTSPIKHLYSRQGCPECGAAKRGVRHDVAGEARRTANTKLKRFAEKFETLARQVHGDKYDYSSVDYKGMRTHAVITCPEHGEFTQTPEHHIYRGHGCPRCSHHASNAEAEIHAFLSTFTRTESRNRKVIRPKELDIYLPDKDMAVEYCGMYWHSYNTQKKERENKNRHLDKQNACNKAGVRLLTIFETDWAERPQAIKRLLRNALGKIKGKLMARKCTLSKTSHSEAVAFFEKYHPQGGAGYGDHYGLYWNGKLVACMRFTYGANDRGGAKSRDWTLTRYATRLPVAGGASRLFKAFVREHNPSRVKSFSDNRFFSGEMYEKLGFVMDKESAPDYGVWHQRLGLMPKSAWQRKKLPARAKELGVDIEFDPETDPRTEREMTYLLGARRIYDCGKKRWVWEP